MVSIYSSQNEKKFIQEFGALEDSQMKSDYYLKVRIVCLETRLSYPKTEYNLLNWTTILNI